MIKFLSLLRVAWDDRFCRLAMCMLAFMAAVSADYLSTLILVMAMFLGTAAAVALAAGGKDELQVRLPWINAVWFGSMFLGALYCATLLLVP